MFDFRILASLASSASSVRFIARAIFSLNVPWKPEAFYHILFNWLTMLLFEVLLNLIKFLPYSICPRMCSSVLTFNNSKVS
jgi:hypothetical protein